MTKKDYELIAYALKNSYLGTLIYPKSLQGFYEVLVERLCDSLKEENPRFDVKKFWEACGLEIE